MPTTYLVLDVHVDKPDEVTRNAIHVFATEAFGQGNDGYFPWQVLQKGDGDEQGLGYLTDDQCHQINEWARSLGAADGQDVLIHNWW